MSPIGVYGNKVPYGYARGKRNLIMLPAASGVAFKDLGAKFVVVDANNDVALVSDGENHIYGWANVGEFTTTASAGADKISVDISMKSQYWVPATNGTLSEAMRGDTCDIAVSVGGIVSADIGNSSDDVLLIVDIDIVNSAVLVKIADGKQQARTVED